MYRRAAGEKVVAVAAGCDYKGADSQRWQVNEWKLDEVGEVGVARRRGASRGYFQDERIGCDAMNGLLQSTYKCVNVCSLPAAK